MIKNQNVLESARLSGIHNLNLDIKMRLKNDVNLLYALIQWLLTDYNWAIIGYLGLLTQAYGIIHAICQTKTASQTPR